MSLGNLVKSLILGVTLSACGGNSSSKAEEPVEYRTSCVDDNDCHSMERCIEDLCDLPPNEPEPEPIPEPEVDKYATDWCDGIDNNGNGLVDEIGCGTLYLHQLKSILSLDLKTGIAEEMFNGDHLDIYTGALYQFSQNGKKIAMGGVSGLYIFNTEDRKMDKIVHTNSHHFAWISNNELVYCGRDLYPYLKRVDSDGGNDQIVFDEFPENYQSCFDVLPTQDNHIMLLMNLKNEGERPYGELLIVSNDGSNVRKMDWDDGSLFGWREGELLIGCDVGTCATDLRGSKRVVVKDYFLFALGKNKAFANPESNQFPGIFDFETKQVHRIDLPERHSYGIHLVE